MRCTSQHGLTHIFRASDRLGYGVLLAWLPLYQTPLAYAVGVICGQVHHAPRRNQVLSTLVRKIQIRYYFFSWYLHFLKYEWKIGKVNSCDCFMLCYQSYLELQISSSNVQRIEVSITYGVQPLGVLSDCLHQLMTWTLDIVLISHIISNETLVETLNFRVGEKRKCY